MREPDIVVSVKDVDSTRLSEVKRAIKQFIDETVKVLIKDNVAILNNYKVPLLSWDVKIEWEIK